NRECRAACNLDRTTKPGCRACKAWTDAHHTRSSVGARQAAAKAHEGHRYKEREWMVEAHQEQADRDQHGGKAYQIACLHHAIDADAACQAAGKKVADRIANADHSEIDAIA